MSWVIHVCPKCGFYDCDPILRRAGGIKCFRCAEEAVSHLDLSRVNRSFHALRKMEARHGAPVMEAVRVEAVEARSGGRDLPSTQEPSRESAASRKKP